MLSARFRIELPEGSYVHDLSTSFPDARFRLLTSLETDDGAVELGELLAEDPGPATEAFAAHPSVSDHEVLVATDDRTMARYRTGERGIHAFLDRFETPPEFPILVENGWFEFDLTTTREAFEGIRAGLDAAPIRYELRSITPAEETTGLLTDRQREALATAFRNGYFAVPRECTLADVAEALSVDKSTASELLRRGQGRLVAWFLRGPEEGAGRSQR